MPTYRAKHYCCSHKQPKTRVTLHLPCHRVPKTWQLAKQVCPASQKVPKWSNKYPWNIYSLYSSSDKPVLSCNKVEETWKDESLTFPALASKKVVLKQDLSEPTKASTQELCNVPSTFYNHQIILLLPYAPLLGQMTVQWPTLNLDSFLPSLTAKI